MGSIDIIVFINLGFLYVGHIFLFQFNWTLFLRRDFWYLLAIIRGEITDGKGTQIITLVKNVIEH